MSMMIAGGGIMVATSAEAVSPGAQPLFAYRTTNSSTTTSTTPSDDTQLTFSVAANTWYSFRAFIRSDCNSATSPPNLLIEWNYPGTASGQVVMYGAGEGGTNLASISGLNNTGQIGGAWSAQFEIQAGSAFNNADENSLNGEGAFRTDTAGTFTMQWAIDSGSNAVRLLTGSWIKMWALE